MKEQGYMKPIICLQNLVENSFRVNRKVYIVFVDLLKAFDDVNWNVTMEML